MVFKPCQAAQLPQIPTQGPGKLLSRCLDACLSCHQLREMGSKNLLRREQCTSRAKNRGNVVRRCFLRKTSAQAGRVLGPRSGLACGEVLQAPADPSRFVSPGGSLRAFRALAHSDVHCGLALRASLAPRRRRVSSGLPLAKRLAEGLSAAAWRSAAEAGWSGHS